MPGETFPPKHGTSLPLSVVNLHVTAKHHLLERDGRSVTSVCDDLVGLHATSNTTPYLSLFNRIQGFKVGVLQQEQDRSESIVRIRAMRGTFFLVTRTQFPLITRATTPPKASILASLSKWGITIKEFRLLTRLILRSISRRPKTALEIKRESSSEELRSLRLRRGWRLVTRTNLNEVLNLLVRLGRVQSRNQRLDWESIDWDGYGSRWFASIKKVLYSTPSMKIEDSTGVVDARAKLVELYIRQYGPVTVRDIAWWIDENETATRKLLKSLTGELVTVQVAGSLR